MKKKDQILLLQYEKIVERVREIDKSNLSSGEKLLKMMREVVGQKKAVIRRRPICLKETGQRSTDKYETDA